MSAGSATLKISTDTKDGQQAIAYLVQQVEKLREANRKLAEESQRSAEQQKKVGEDGSRAFDKMVGSVKGALLGITSVSGIMATVISQIEKMEQIEDRMRGKSITIGGAQGGFMGNTGAGTDEQKAAKLREARDAARQAGIPEQVAIGAMSNIMSTTGADIATTKSSFLAASRISGTDDSMRNELGAGGAFISSITGSQDPREAQALILSAQAQSMVRTTSGVAQNLPIAAQSSVLNDTTGNHPEAARQGAAFWSFLTNAGDVQGPSSTTAANTLQEQLNAFWPKDEYDPGSTDARIRALQADKKLGEKFLSGMTTEARFRPLMQGLIRGDANIGSTYNRIMSGTVSDVGLYESQAKAMSSATPQLNLAMMSQKSEALQGQAETAAPSLSYLSQMRETTNKQYDYALSAGMWDPVGLEGGGIRLNRYFNSGSTPVERARFEYQRSKGLLKKAMPALTDGVLFPRTPMTDEEQIQFGIDNAKTPEQAELLKVMREVVAYQKQMLETMQNGNADAKAPTVQPNLHVEGR